MADVLSRRGVYLPISYLLAMYWLRRVPCEVGRTHRGWRAFIGRCRLAGKGVVAPPIGRGGSASP